jgi:predicted Holliday junction resolvase-like endonuclease
MWLNIIILTIAAIYTAIVAYLFKENLILRGKSQLVDSLRETLEEYKKNSNLLEKSYQDKLITWTTIEEKRVRKEALNRSRSIMRGFTTEQFAPFLQEEWKPADYRFMGNPIDYIIFVGLSDVSDGKASDISKVVLLDVKTGKSQLTKVQRRIRDAVNAGRVEFHVVNPDKVTKQQTTKELEI